VNIQPAYELDDLTFGALWAVANLDDALLADDLALSESLPTLTAYDRLDSSSVSRAAASELTAISLGWVGSEFCARHILRHMDAPDEPPVFWTREQRGEEACTWLLYRHKHEYLRRTTPPAMKRVPAPSPGTAQMKVHSTCRPPRTPVRKVVVEHRGHGVAGGRR
jgi:hypothetical protein